MVSDADLLDKLSDQAGRKKAQTALDRLIGTIVAEVREFAEAKATEIKRLADIGIALSAERNLERLLERIVDEARRFTHADAGTLYTVQTNASTHEPELKFDILQNDTMKARQGGTSGKAITLPPVPMVKGGQPNRNNVSAYVANTGETVNIADVYTAEGFDFSGTRKFDQITGYRTRSMLVSPMRNHENEIIGVLQLINATEAETNKVIAFSAEYEDLIKSLASQAAIAITNTKLIADLRELFESLIRLVAAAIDEKSPYTGGHITRVAGLSVKLAETINEIEDGPYKDVRFTPDEMNELRIAAWLHDIGKITTPEYVVDKGTKLETIFDRVELVKMRFEAIRRGMEIEAQSRRLGLIRTGADAADIAAFEAEHARQLAELDGDRDFVVAANAPGEFLKDDVIERLKRIAARKYVVAGEETAFTADALKRFVMSRDRRKDLDSLKKRFESLRPLAAAGAAYRKDRLTAEGADGAALNGVDSDFKARLTGLDADLAAIASECGPDGSLKEGAEERLKPLLGKRVFVARECPYLTDDELLNLSIRKGSLTDKERLVIQNHAAVTIKMLSQIPFPKKLSHVVEYAGAHHEKLNGTGYPNGWTAEQLKLQSRILCLSDICEALTARDRPYKPAMPKERAFQILGFMVKDQEIDGDLLKTFLDKNVYDRFMEDYDAQQKKGETVQLKAEKKPA